MNPGEFLREIIAALESAGVPNMLTGSFASSFHGTPRATQDLDIVISPNREGLGKLLALFPPERYYIDRDAAFEALDRKSQFNLIAPRVGWKVDFIIRKPRPFNLREFERRIPANVFGVPLNIVTPEDLILAKLEWSAEGGSQRQIEDAAGILRARRVEIDRDYLERGVKELAIEPEWEKARNLAGISF